MTRHIYIYIKIKPIRRKKKAFETEGKNVTQTLITIKVGRNQSENSAKPINHGNLLIKN